MDKKLAATIDHTILKPTTKSADVRQLCVEAVKYGFAAVCVPPIFVEEAAEFLAKEETKVATVVGFPMGYHQKEVKAEETMRAIADGADEIDMVVSIADLSSGNWEAVKQDIALQSELCHATEVQLKVIIESGLLEETEIRKVCEICTEVGVDYVKTSTGFHGTGAELKTVELMRSVLPASIKIKASGGIRDKATALAMIEAGADRIGASAGVKIVTE